jgi:hypothetical protein
MQVASLPLVAQTAFAQLLEGALAADHQRSVADLSGAFATKTVKGHKYWYYQYTEPAGVRRQVFIGPDNEAVRALVEKAKEHTGDNVRPLARAAAILGCEEIFPRHYRVLQRLAEYGFFRAGGILIGTHAFVAYGNMLGVKWGAAAASRTQDIDFAHAGKSISLALTKGFSVHTHDAIESLKMGFLPIAGLAGKAGGAYLIPSEKEFRLDFLTVVGRGGEVPYEHPDLHVTLQPLKFMEFSLENVQQTALISGDNATLVNVPHPARFAIHKLIIAGLREGAFRIKEGKDIQQAASLLSVLRDSRPWEIGEAWGDALSRGKGCETRARRGLLQLCRKFPEEHFDQLLP